MIMKPVVHPHGVAIEELIDQRRNFLEAIRKLMKANEACSPRSACYPDDEPAWDRDCAIWRERKTLLDNMHRDVMDETMLIFAQAK